VLGRFLDTFKVKRQSKISVQVHDDEAGWGGFLVDDDSFLLTEQWEHTKKATAHTDQDIVREAKKECRTIVTSNAWILYDGYNTIRILLTIRIAVIFGVCSGFQIERSPEQKN